MKSKILNLAVVIISAFIFITFFLFTKGLKALIDEIMTLNFSWLLTAIILIIAFWIFESLVIYVITKELHPIDDLFIKSIRFQIIGQFFGAITPFSAGSHPAQLYEMTESGIPIGIAGSISMIKFIIHQITNILILLMAFLLRFNYFYSRVNYFLYLCFSGLIVHIITMILAVLFLFSHKLTKKLLILIFKILNRFKLLKNIDSSYNKVEKELENFHENALLITKYKKMCMKASILTILQWLAFFSIPYCIYRSFGFNAEDIITMIAAQVFLVNFMVIIPLPGAEGGAEGGFYLIYGLFFKSGTIITAIFLWRLITYYSSIAIGSILSLLFPHNSLQKNKT
ncbi:lysylphosphatidylglycerol synthase transmembrane domain-containing protein [Clostridium sp. C8-1-8]|uniref:lysylphosphatidylglycerol synthase transmembrane domain-containing protein n=1 Tax=Clostridium sp. C8-1-8 TaxID=2698831 RepID=UPI00136C34E0|nr:lysylphosphatidylglycerol synthase transmembrane domain-containing protein [Clostridium sp. C8-1-8]